MGPEIERGDVIAVEGKHERYFERIEAELDHALEVARTAKERGGDPSPSVEIPVAQDMADRVENLLDIPGLADRIRELEGELSREEAALALAEDFATGTVGEETDPAEKIEGAVRTAVALLTEGVVAAPIEGIDSVELLTNDDGSKFVNVYYAGPIRSAGGTAQALSVLVADYTRALLGIDQYHARSEEIERYAEEVALYDSETGLQYSPKSKETKFIARNLPIMLDGEATGEEEVSGYRNLDRVDTNSARGGMCLVLAEGIALKAPKIQRYTNQLEEVDWPWLEDLIDGSYDDSEGARGDGGEIETVEAEPPVEPDVNETEEIDGPTRVQSESKYLRDLIAGRPVFSHPSSPGGFRLRYGRARNHGFATAGIHPATMHLVDDFLATGTQVKTERPGKAAGVVPVDSIDGPTVKLATGEVRTVDDVDEAKEVRNGVVSIVDLGEYLVNFGEFIENNHRLAPASYVAEWWKQELAETDCDLQALEDDPTIDLEHPTVEEAVSWSKRYDVPLHPAFTYLWHDLPVDAFDRLASAVADGRIDDGTLVIDSTPELRSALETIVIEHRQFDDRIEVDSVKALVASLGVTDDLEKTWELADLSERARTWAEGENAIVAVNEVAPYVVRERAPTRIGNRMGRPEKSESRDLSPAVHTLFPIGEAGGAQRNVSDASDHSESSSEERGVIEVPIATLRCPECATETYEHRCLNCDVRTEAIYHCPRCENDLESVDGERPVCPRCEIDGTSVNLKRIDLDERYTTALDTVGERETSFEILKGVKGLTSTEKAPEPLEKGILRAKHDVTTFKDGTVRYDMTDLPVTAVRPAELDVSAERFRALGYEHDVHGDPLEHDDQLVELKIQDVVLSDGAAEHMLKTAAFVDDLLEGYYGCDRYYDLEERDDLIGELVFGMAPHTSAAVVGRVVGFTSAAVGYAHPYFHAAKRRNCFHPETTIVTVDEAGERRETSIESLVESNLDTPQVDAWGVRTQELDGTISVPSIDGHGRRVHRTVRAVSKHPAPEHLVQIRLTTGESVRVTADHRILRITQAGSIERVSAKSIDVGDRIPIDDDTETNGFDAVGVSTDGGVGHATVDSVEIIQSDVEYTYCLTVDKTHTLLANGMYTGQCDGDEDCVMLLMDGLLNFSRSYLPDKRGGSVAEGDRVVAIDPEDRIRFPTFEQLWSDLDRPIEIDGKFQKKTIADTDWRTFAFDDDHRIEAKPIERIMRYRATDDDRVRRIHTEGGRSIDITTDHSLFRYDDGIEAVAGSDLDVGDLIVAPGNLNAMGEQAGRHAVRSDGGIASSGILQPGAVGDGTTETPIANGLTELATMSDRDGSICETLLLGSDADIRAFITNGLATANESAASADGMVNVVHTDREELKELVAFACLRIGIVPEIQAIDSGETYVVEIPRQSIGAEAGDSGLSETVPVPNVLDELRSMDVDGLDRPISVDPDRDDSMSRSTLSDIYTRLKSLDLPERTDHLVDEIGRLATGDLAFLRITDIEERPYEGHLYDLQVGGLPIFTCNWLFAHNSMDAPLVMSSRIDPTEIDDEAHNIDIVDKYPKSFYEATLEMADPEEVSIQTAADTLDDRPYSGFDHTHDTSDIAMGPDLSAYKTLGSMTDKMDAQLELARKLRAVDERDVAERVIEYHFLPDLIGNLRAFSRQETRCVACGLKYRRVPLSETCRNCGGNVTLTVHEGSVRKYLQTAQEIAEEFGCREYTKQRLEVLQRSIESIFEDDTNKQSGIEDFM